MDGDDFDAGMKAYMERTPQDVHWTNFMITEIRRREAERRLRARQALPNQAVQDVVAPARNPPVIRQPNPPNQQDGSRYTKLMQFKCLCVLN